MAASDRLNASKLALWVAADDSTTPVVGDAVGSVRRLNPNFSRPLADQTAAGDSWQYHTAGIPGGTLTVEIEMQGDDYQLFGEFDDGLPHNFYIVPTTDDSNDVLSSTGILESWSADGSVQAGWRVTATFRCNAAVVETHGV